VMGVAGLAYGVMTFFFSRGKPSAATATASKQCRTDDAFVPHTEVPINQGVDIFLLFFLLALTVCFSNTCVGVEYFRRSTYRPQATFS